MLGTVGTEYRLDGSAISDAVNTAARISDINRVYGTFILMSESTYYSLENPQTYRFRRVDTIKLKGKSEPILILEVLSDCYMKHMPKPSTVTAFEEAWTAYQKGNFQTAIKLFEKYLKLVPDDKASELFLARCKDLVEKGCPADWDGVAKFE